MRRVIASALILWVVASAACAPMTTYYPKLTMLDELALRLGVY